MPQLLEEDSHSSDAPPGGIGREHFLSVSERVTDHEQAMPTSPRLLSPLLVLLLVEGQLENEH